MKKIAFSLAILLGSSAAVAAAPQCPAEINVSQTLSAPVAGWKSFQKPLPSRLSSIAFYDGPPEEQVELAPDGVQKAKTTETATWKFTPEPGRSIWVVCLYSETTQSLAQELPKGTKTCTISYDGRQKISGLSVIEKVACK